MIKERKSIIKLMITTGALFLGLLIFNNQSVKAAVTVHDDSSINVVSSGGYPAPIYSDPQCTQPTGQTLNTTISEWRVNHIAYDDSNNQNTFQSFDLGTNQWVKIGDVFYTIDPNSPENSYGYHDILEAFSSGKKIPIYNNPQLSKITGYLDPNISEWAVTGDATTGPDKSIGRLNLGQNQWIDASQVVTIYNSYIFNAGTPLYNESGVQTGTLSTINGSSILYYRAFGAKIINGEIHIRLGTNNQWAKLKQSYRDI
ncbi:hypothetical protein ACNAN0_02125 [Agrilactobacillus fermenti]|uniref:hypothetical protein n=1 Tax=Agrilactobacillus fermenti TaxID=2586909 RepID=UPI003A5C3A24